MKVVIKRGGRPPKQNVIRDSSGKSRGEIFDPNFFFRQPHRRGIVEVMGEKGIDHTIPRNVALAGFPLGRLRLSGLISADQLRAGSDYAAVVRSYARQNNIPTGSTKSGSLSEFVGGGFYLWENDSVGPTPDEIDLTKNRYNKCHETLAELGRMHGRGRNILIVMREICVAEVEERALWHDQSRLGDLRLGLNAVQKVLVERR